MKFALLCSGSKGNCFLLWDESLFLQIDCGSSGRYLKQCYAQLHVSMSDLDALLITHDHSDHISQLKLFQDRTIYAPVELNGYNIIPVKPMEKFQLQHLTITPLSLSHDARNTTGYIIENWHEKLVYVTDTGYVKESYFPLMKGADYIILESNHDPQMLMETRRPYYLKQRILGENGHLCNEDCAEILKNIVTENTKMVVLAHISQQANTREKALETSRNVLKEAGVCRPGMILAAAGQYEIIKGGDWENEKTDSGTCSCSIGMECMADLSDHRD